MINVLGIRHHGPGSTKRMLQSLSSIQPDCILIEMPADAQAIIEYVDSKQLTPPVALLLYNPKQLKEAYYYPFTHFSPEWQAIRYGLKQGIPLKMMDIPAGLQVDKADLENRIGFPDIKLGQEVYNEKLVKDPLGVMAGLAGYQDGERWWEAQFENIEETQSVFPIITEMIATLRAEVGGNENPINLLREAHMRKVLRQQIKAGYQNIVIVCGAWHAPALQNWQNFSQKEDNALLKGLKKQKTNATWVPWSYNQLAPASGYGAGVISPAWYDLLYSNRSTAVPRWMIKVARLLRQKNLTASTANVIEATRLASTLATLRDKSIPSLEELEEATIATFCKGNTFYLELIRKKLIIGDKIGKIGPDIPKVPLVADLEKNIKSARLTNEWQTTDSIQKDLDLRKPSNLLASHLLHRLNILNIKWGKLRKGSRFKLGGFSENWTLKRRTDHAIKIIAAARWGNTVKEAASNIIKHECQTEKKLVVLSQFIDKALKADLPATIPLLVQKLKSLTAQSKDLLELIEALPKLVQITRYGNTRKTDIEAIQQILEQIIPRICIGIANVSSDIDDDLAKKIFNHLVTTNHALGLLNNRQYNDQWHLALNSLANSPLVHPLLRGFSNRLLFDKSKIKLKEASIQLQFALSIGQNTSKKVQWIEGFLYGNGLLLIYNTSLWQLIDQWVSNLSYTEFRSNLPLLRRAFSNFSASERQVMMRLAKNDQRRKPDDVEFLDLDFETQKSAIGVIQKILD